MRLNLIYILLIWLSVFSVGCCDDEAGPIQSGDGVNSLNFLLHGDWGWNSFNQTMTAYEMGVYAWLIDAKFVVALGDNFYEDGVQSTTDSLWKTVFHDVYSSIYLQIPWYPVLGNHDYHGNVDAEVQRTLIDGGMWTMPSRYYAYNYSLPDGGTLCIVYIDTCAINPEQGDTSKLEQDIGYLKRKQDHLEWIDRVLGEQNKTATWLVVAGHYPIYSMGEHGDDPYLIDALLPILLKHKVHAYFSGHDHLHEHIYMHGMNFFVTGGGSGRGPLGPHGYQNLGVSVATNYIKHWHQTCGFAFVEVDSSNFNLTFVDNIGKIRYTTVIDNPHNRKLQIVPFGNGLPGLGVSASVVSILILLPAIIIAVGIIAYLSRLKYDPINSPFVGREGTRIRLDVVDSSTHSAMALREMSSRGRSHRVSEFHV